MGSAQPADVLEEMLQDWKLRAGRIDDERDGLVRAANRAGVAIKRISELSGLSRTTVYKILGIQEGGQQ